MAIKKVEIDQELCISCGTCGIVAPDVFEVQDSGKYGVKEGADIVANEEKINESAEQCPVSAIIVEKEKADSGEEQDLK